MIGCVLLAAGRGLRFGENKLLARWEGRTLLDRAIDAIPLGLQAVAVVSSPETARIAAARGLPVIRNDRPEDGISRSVRLGTEALPDCEAILYLVADQPWLCREGVERVLGLHRDFPDAICAASSAGKRGNPCLFPRRFFPELTALEGDRGGSAVIRRHEDCLRLIELPALQLRDIDTRADLSALKEELP